MLLCSNGAPTGIIVSGHPVAVQPAFRLNHDGAQRIYLDEKRGADPLASQSSERQDIRNVQARVAGTILSRDQLAFLGSTYGRDGAIPTQRLHCTPLVKFKDADICFTHGPGVDELAASCCLPGCPRPWRVSTRKHPGESLAEDERLARPTWST